MGIVLYGHSCNYINNYKKQNKSNVKKVNFENDYNEEFVPNYKFETEDSIQEFTPKKSKKFGEDKKDN